MSDWDDVQEYLHIRATTSDLGAHFQCEHCGTARRVIDMPEADFFREAHDFLLRHKHCLPRREATAGGRRWRTCPVCGEIGWCACEFKIH